MQRSLEQRMAIKFCVKLEKSAAETIQMLKKACGVDCLSDRQIYRWHKAFAGREDVKPPKPALQTLDITKTIVHEIVSESLGMRKVCAKLVPKVLTDDQKARRTGPPPERQSKGDECGGKKDDGVPPFSCRRCTPTVKFSRRDARPPCWARRRIRRTWPVRRDERMSGTVAGDPLIL
ncbi:hypothetical protein NQ318_015737 [Aromia moschata]|uniref:Mos1 transposase HTH domain-containing protein n=1 Tax=Aromia moschata TaxID=1265417 RepID=A0AAV8Y1J6_9CUCU|nr:hypothetical protein NQ318_015737 [Aromia moschata]